MGEEAGRVNAGLFPADDFEVAAAVEQALHLARSGSAEGLGRLLEIYRPYLLSIANNELPDGLAGKVAPSDLVQETIVKGLRQFGRFEGARPEELALWLRQILLHELANSHAYYTRGKRDVGREVPVGKQQPLGQQASPSEEVRRQEKRQIVEAAISRLPENYQKVIRLRHTENLSFGEIAALMNNSLDGVQKMWMRAIQSLQQQLGGDSSWRV